MFDSLFSLIAFIKLLPIFLFTKVLSHNSRDLLTTFLDLTVEKILLNLLCYSNETTRCNFLPQVLLSGGADNQLAVHMYNKGGTTSKEE